METHSERQKALGISLIGALFLVFMLYGSMWVIRYVIEFSTQPTTSSQQTITNQSARTTPPTNGPSDPTAEIILPDLANISLEYQSASHTDPYIFNLDTYVVNQVEGQGTTVYENINKKIETFVESEKSRFEAILLSSFGTINSPDSFLSIRATEIREQADEIIIDYEIITYISGDTAPTSRLFELVVLNEIITM
jgi:hypothetical protein